MITIIILAMLGTGGYFGFEKVKQEDRNDKVTKSCLDLAKSAEDTTNCSKLGGK